MLEQNVDPEADGHGKLAEPFGRGRNCLPPGMILFGAVGVALPMPDGRDRARGSPRVTSGLDPPVSPG